MEGTVYLARHGQTAYNAQRRFQGQLHVPLDDVGRAQAVALAGAAAGHGLVALHASPLRRAWETATTVADALGLEAVPDDRLKETDTGDWTDRLFADVEREDPEGFAAYHATAPDFAFPGGESLTDQTARVQAAVADVRAGPRPALIVAHRGVIRCLRSATDPRGLSAFMSFDVPNATLQPL